MSKIDVAVAAHDVRISGADKKIPRNGARRKYGDVWSARKCMSDKTPLNETNTLQCKAGGKPSTWFPPERLAEQDSRRCIFSSKRPLNTYISFLSTFLSNFENFKFFIKNCYFLKNLKRKEKINQIIIFTFNMLYVKRIRYLEFNIKFV